MLPENMAAMFILGDQPLIKPHVFHGLCSAYQNSDALIVAPCAPDGKRGNPTIFAPQLRAEINALQGDVGARSLFEKYAARTAFVTMADQAVCIDIDDPAQYQAYRGFCNESND